MFTLSRFVMSKYREHVGEHGDDISETGGQKSRHVRRFGDESTYDNHMCIHGNM